MSTLLHEKRLFEAELNATANAHRLAHVWKSPAYGEAEVVIHFAWPGESIDEQSHGLPADHAARIAVYYAGVMDPERAVERLALLREAWTSASL